MIWRAQMCWFHLVSNSCRNNALSAGAASSRGLALQRSLWSLPPSTALHPSYRGLNSGYDFGNTSVIRRLGLGLCESAPGSMHRSSISVCSRISIIVCADGLFSGSYFQAAFWATSVHTRICSNCSSFCDPSNLCLQCFCTYKVAIMSYK
jgi:hypothetical protein